jgi:peptide/nickel transport system substrate-binding protein
MRRSRTALVLAATAVAAVASAGAAGREPRSPAGGTYRFGIESYIGDDRFRWSDGFDPTGEWQIVSFAIYSNLLLRTLLGYEHAAGRAGQKLVPDLATRVPHPENGGRTYTFTLKRGVRFGPPVDREITSNDVRYALERLARPRNGAQYAFYFDVIRGFDAYRKRKARSISGIETPDARTIRFTLVRPTGDFAHRLTLPAAAPIPHEVARCFEGRPGAYGADLVSSGPYMIEGADAVDDSSCRRLGPMRGLSDTRLTLVRNPRYDPGTDTKAQRESNPDRFVFVSFPGNPTQIVDAVNAGELEDAHLEPSMNQVIRRYAAKARRLGRLRVSEQAKVIFVAMNLTRPPFDDVHVRRALNWIVDRAAYRAAYGGPAGGRVAQHIVPDALLGDRLKDFAPFRSAGDHGDLARAKAELARSKYATSNGICVAKACKAIHLKRDGPYGPGERIVPLFKAEAARIGLMFINRGARLDEPASNNEIDVNVDWTIDYADPSNFLDWFAGAGIVPSGNNNYSLVGITGRQADRLGVRGRVANVPSVDAHIRRCSALAGDERLDCYAQLDRKLTTDVVPWIPFLWRNYVTILGPQVAKWRFDEVAGTTAFAHVAVKG